MGNETKYAAHWNPWPANSVSTFCRKNKQKCLVSLTVAVGSKGLPGIVSRVSGHHNCFKREMLWPNPSSSRHFHSASGVWWTPWRISESNARNQVVNSILSEIEKNADLKKSFTNNVFKFCHQGVPRHFLDTCTIGFDSETMLGRRTGLQPTGFDSKRHVTGKKLSPRTAWGDHDCR